MPTIQEQLKKIDGELKETARDLHCNIISVNEGTERLRTSAIELVKSVVSQEIERLEKLRTLEIEALENAKLVPDRHYHKGKIHLIDDSIASLQEIIKEIK